MVPVETDKMRILRPDAVGNDKLLHVDIYKTGILEPLLQPWPRTDLVTSLFESAVEFIEVPLECGTVETPVC